MAIPIRRRRSPHTKSSLDFSQIREAVRGAPTNYLAYATVGHSDVTPTYARIENNQVYVEITLQPSGDEIVARLETGGGSDQAGFYLPLAYGARVIVGLPGGTGTEAIIIGRCNDAAWPFPETVAGVATHVPVPAPGHAPAPLWTFLRTADGYLLGIETGDGGDIVIHSGASVEIKVNSGEQILLKGPTHLGATFSSPPTGAAVTAGGEVTPGVQGAAFVPTPYIAPPYAPVISGTTPDPLTPEDGIVRMKDSVQSSIEDDPAFWAWVAAVSAALIPPIVAPAIPTSLTCSHRSASKHTASDE